ncbi:MAG: hypothetical protein PHD72_03260 [Patescibacteria group bacterium]|nr:hypothetical protein [Patescibacteria group bacterium]
MGKIERDKDFSLSRAMPQLKEFMRRPIHTVNVAIVDDSAIATSGILEILECWPYIITHMFVQHEGCYPDISCRHDIVLLDESMDELTGTAVVERLQGLGFPGLIASISKDKEAPAWAKPNFHFPYKVHTTVSFEAAASFVYWINELIEEVERDRMD